MIEFDALRAHQFEPVFQSYTAKDCLLYALGLNIGADPMNPVELRHAAGDPPIPVAAMSMNLARLGPWMRDPSVGIDYTRILVGEVSLRVHAPLPPEATVCGRHRIVRVTDKGAGKGALVTVRRDLTDTATGALLAEFEQVTFCRGDGGFAVDGRHDPAPTPEPWEVDDRPPDWIIPMPTSPQQALIYRLSGDMNPLHSDPEVARKAGFDRPILHGLSVMGMVGYALGGGAGPIADTSLRCIRGRLTTPVFPGELLTIEAWNTTGPVFFRVVDSHGRVVIARGSAELQYVG